MIKSKFSHRLCCGAHRTSSTPARSSRPVAAFIPHTHRVPVDPDRSSRSVRVTVHTHASTHAPMRSVDTIINQQHSSIYVYMGNKCVCVRMFVFESRSIWRPNERHGARIARARSPCDRCVAIHLPHDRASRKVNANVARRRRRMRAKCARDRKIPQ